MARQRTQKRNGVTGLNGVKDDLAVLKSIWFKKVKGDDHAARLESFYGPQAHACEYLPPERLILGCERSTASCSNVTSLTWSFWFISPFSKQAMS